LRPAGLIADRNQQRRDVLAVLVGLSEGRTRTMRLDAVGSQLDRDRVGLGLRRSNRARGRHLVDCDILDDATTEILKSPKERSGAEQPAKATVA
jgi:hypothetical protein